MSDLADIPIRDTKGGAAQLVTLRSYLKDLDNANYRFPDQFLIDLLVPKTAVVIWQGLNSVASTVLPWTYKADDTTNHITLIRLLVADTDEDIIAYTDYEYLKLLEVIPLRYVISIMNARKLTGFTYPSDVNNPIRIIRNLTGDTDGSSQADTPLIDALILSGKNPYGYVIDSIVESTGNSQVASAKTGASMASIDGISFKEASTQIADTNNNKSAISAYSLDSAYTREPVFAFYSEGVDKHENDWKVKWYAL